MKKLKTMEEMVEYLGDSLDCMLHSTAWTVQLDMNNDGKIIEFREEELCDALAEAVKFKLKNK